METLRAQSEEQPIALAKKLFELERCGRYEKALSEAKKIWNDISKLPQVEVFEAKDAAELLLRCGALIGFIGHQNKIPNAQSKSRYLLTKAKQRFSELCEAEKAAECEVYLALAYWRTGELNEAKTWIEETLSHELPISNYAVLYAHIAKCLIFIAENKYSQLIVHLKILENDFLRFSDNCLRGDFYNSLGIAFNEIGNQTEALKCSESALHFHIKSGHKIYLGTVENNLAQIYKLQKDFVKAHEMVDCATKTFKQIKDRTREGFSLDTKAQIFLHESKFNDALKTVEKALKILSKSENKAYLVETMLTKVKCLVFLDDFVAATLLLTEAVQIARINIGEDAAVNLVKEFERAVQAKNSPAANPNSAKTATDEEVLDFLLPAEISHYDGIHVVKIQRDLWESVGLKSGSLAIVGVTKVKRGDLVAIEENDPDSVLLGYYDADFGIVCLETGDSEPELFDENEVKILGKVVGVCNFEKNARGQLIVETVKI